MSPAVLALAAPLPRRPLLFRLAPGLLLLLIVLLAAAFHADWLRAALQQVLASRSGRSVQIEQLQLRWLDGSPVVRLRGVRVQNAPWADTQQPLAVAGELVFTFDWRSLLAREPRVTRLVMRDAEIDLERLPDGRRNWRLTQPGDTGPPRFHVLAVEAHRSRLRFAHRGIGLDMQLAATDAAAPLATQLDVEGRLRGTRFTARLFTEPVISLKDSGALFAVRGQAATGASQLRLDGRLADVLTLGRVDADVQLSGPSLAAWRAFTPWTLPATQPYRLEAHWLQHDKGSDLSRLRLKLGSTDAVGDLQVRRQEDRPMVRATLQSAQLVAADLLPPQRQAEPSPAESRWPGHRLPLGRLDHADWQIDWRARQFRLNATVPVLQELALSADLKQGRLALAPVQAGFGGGRLTGGFVLDSRSTPPAVQADLRLDDVRIERLWPALPDDKRVSGGIDATLRLAGQGDSMAAWVASAAGTVQLALRGGSIANRLDAELGLNGGKLLRAMLTGPAQIAVDCAAADIDVRAGQGQVRRLAFDSARTHVDGHGRIDLRDTTLDLLLLPRARDHSLLVLPSALRLHGLLTQPQVAITARPQGLQPAVCTAKP
jgi:uncharacterized protein involved in outer membrane biogenesis